MKKVLILSVLGVLTAVAAGKVAYAQTGCDGIYNGGTNCGTNGFILKKQVSNPANNQFVDNLGTNDPHYHPGNLIFFKFTVTNNTNSDLTGVTVTDTLDPKFVSYRGDASIYNANSSTVTFNIGSLAKGQSQTRSITGLITSAENLPDNQQITCVVNHAQANAENGQGTQASSQFCIEKVQSLPTNNQSSGSTTKGGLPVSNQGQSNAAQPTGYPVYTPSPSTKQTPKSGPEALPLLAMIPTGAFGLWLRRKAK